MCCVLGQDTNSHSGKFNAGGTPVMDLYPIQGEQNTPCRFMHPKIGEKRKPEGPLGSYTNLFVYRLL